MKNSTAIRLRQLPEGHLLLGLDCHKKRHVAVLMNQQAAVHTRFKFSNSREGFEDLLRRVGSEVARTGSPGVTYAIEAGGHFWRNVAYYFRARDIPFRLISPFTLSRRREGEDNDRRKNDFRDAEMAAELLRTGKYLATRLPEGIYAELRATCQAYRRLVEERSRSKNLLKTLLDGLFPEFTQAFRDPSAETARALLSLRLTPQRLRQRSAVAFVDGVARRLPGGARTIRKLKLLHALAGTSVAVEAGSEGVALEVALLAEKLGTNADHIERQQRRLFELVKEAPESRYLLSIPGVSHITVAGILAELGPLSAYQNAGQLIKMAGTNPTQSESADKSGSRTPMSKKGRSGLRWCLWMASLNVIQHNQDFAQWARARRERPAHEHPLEHREVLGAGCNKLLRVIFALVKKQECYRAPAGAR